MSQASNLKVSRYPSTILHCNLYLLENEEGEVVIDPAVPYHILYAGRKDGLRAIILTHCHFDHLYAIESYLERTSCPVYMHKNGIKKLEDPVLNESALMGMDMGFQVPEERIVAIESDCVHNLLGLDFLFLETPGHSDCSLSILVDGLLFSGDTLFKNTVGRTDLHTSDSGALERSLEKLLALGNFPVYPGHSVPTSIDAERRTNPYLRR